MLSASKQKAYIKGSFGCNPWSEHGKEFEPDWKKSDIFGLLFLGDGATISRVPLLNILVSGKNLPVAVLELVDLQGHLADDGTNNSIFIYNRLLDHFKRIDPHKSIIVVVMFDGA